MNFSLTHHTQTPLFPLENVETIDVISEAVRSSTIPRTSIICTENGMKLPLSQQIQSPISSLVNGYKSIRQEKSILAAASQQFYVDIIDHISVKQSINTNIINNTVYLDNGDANFTCEFCEAIMWYDERIYKSKQLERPVFSMCCAQGKLYIYDTEHEVENRINVMSNRSKPSRNSLDVSIINDLKNMLDDNNSLVKSFRMVTEQFQSDSDILLRLKLIGEREFDGRIYNMPTVGEVAALIVGYTDESFSQRDVNVETRTCLLKRISEFHPSYISLQYPLLFPYGEDGYRVGIQHSDAVTPSEFIREYYTPQTLSGRIRQAKHKNQHKISTELIKYEPIKTNTT
ncbi:hypothetical protein OROMI_003735 [Orobanche minor]